MITALDTSVLIDVLGGDRVHGPASAHALRSCLTEGTVIVSDVVWAEASSGYPVAEPFRVTLDRLGIDFLACDRESAEAAGAAWRRYREHGGTRARLIADFLVGAHAAVLADRLLTRDRGFFRRYFRDLRIVDPSQG
jgi:predicted nucleic acid-binding protein